MWVRDSARTMTDEEVHKAALRSTVAFGGSIDAPQMMAGNNMPFADMLVGHAFSWSYSDQMTSMHLYTTPNSHSWTIFTENQAMGAQWCAPAIYVKIRDGIYILSVTEEACNGHQMIVMINTRITHDCGFGFSGGAGGVNLGLTGAIGRHIGKYDVRHYFGPKANGKGA